MGSRVRIAVAEPSIIIRSGVVSVLKKIASLNIDVAEISNIAQLSQQLCRIQPDLLIVDPSQLGVFSLQQIKDSLECKELKFVALHSNLTCTTVLNAYDAVISVYDTADHIGEIVTELIHGSDDLAARQELTAREKEIVVCVVKGMSNKQIADYLSLSMHTIMTHRKNIINKLQIHSPSGLTIYALANKLIEFDTIKSLYLNNNDSL